MKNGQFDCAKPYEVGTMLPERTELFVITKHVK